MLKIHTIAGDTVCVDWDDETQAQRWLKHLADPHFQSQITGMSVARKCGARTKCNHCGKPVKIHCARCKQEIDENSCTVSAQTSLTKPEGFGQAFYHAQHSGPNQVNKIKGNEKIVCFADDVRVIVTVHHSQPSAHVSLVKTGKQRYNPFIKEH